MIVKKGNIIHLLMNKYNIYVILVLGIILIFYFIKRNKGGKIYDKLQSYSNINYDSLRMNRCKEIYPLGGNFDFKGNEVELPPMNHVPGEMDGGMKELEQAISDATGTWQVISEKPDSILISTPNNPFCGRYAIKFRREGPYNNMRYYFILDNDSTHIVCEKIFKYANPVMKNWDSE